MVAELVIDNDGHRRAIGAQHRAVLRKSLFRGRGEGEVAAFGCQLPVEYSPVAALSDDDQDSKAVELIRDFAGDWRIALSQADCKSKNRALLQNAVDFDGAAHGLCEALGYRQSQAGAAEAPRRRAVRLNERGEQRVHSVFRNAD